MKRILFIAILFCAALSFGSAVAQQDMSAQSQLTNASNATVLKEDSGTNLSEMKVMYFSAQSFKLDPFNTAVAVKFTAPKPGWKLKSILVLGWNGFNATEKVLPPEGDFLLEIRDSKLDLLYRLSDSQNAYFTFNGPGLAEIEIPALPLTGDFYIMFYDRGNLVVVGETGNSTATDHSFIFDKFDYSLSPADFTTMNATTNMIGITKTNWVIRAVGE